MLSEERLINMSTGVQALPSSLYQQSPNQPSCPLIESSQEPSNQLVNTVVTDLTNLINAISNAHFFIPSTEFLANVKFHKSPFYEDIGEVLKVSTLVGSRVCFSQNMMHDMKSAVFNITLSPEHAMFLSMTRDMSNGENDDIYQIHMRISLVQSDFAEIITDCFPSGLHIKINDCAIPLIDYSTQSITRNLAMPINCSKLFELSPNVSNVIVINWISDVQTYVMGINLVKKLTVEDLILKLVDKKPISPEETKYCIIQMLAVNDQDLITISNYFSLICPLKKTKIKIPAKFTLCEHLQCFDARAFILMNEKKSTWVCPICDIPCCYDNLLIDGYFLEVLLSPKLPDNCDKIVLLEDGTWKAYIETAVNVNGKPVDCVNLEDNDDENIMEHEEEHNSDNVSNPIGFESVEPCCIDLTSNDYENPTKEKVQ